MAYLPVIGGEAGVWISSMPKKHKTHKWFKYNIVMSKLKRTNNKIIELSVIRERDREREIDR